MDENNYLSRVSNEEMDEMLDIALSPNYEEESSAYYDLGDQE